MTLDEEIKRLTYNAEYERTHGSLQGCLDFRQLAEWLRELQKWREFGDWVVKAVLDDGWEDNADFYAEVLCRKLTKLGKLKLKDHKYMEINADDNN